MLGEVMAGWFIGESLTDMKRSNIERKNEKESYLLVEWGIVGFLFLVAYIFTWIFDLSQAGINKVLYYFTYPLHWELAYAVQEDNYLKWFIIGAAVVILLGLTFRLILQSMNERLIQSKIKNPLFESIGHSVYLLSLTILFWLRLTLTVAITKLILCTFFYMVGVLI